MSDGIFRKSSSTEKILAFSLKLDLVISSQSLAEEWLFFGVFNTKSKLGLEIVIFSWVVEFLDNILAFSLKRDCSGGELGLT